MTAIIKYNLLHFVKGGNTRTHKKIGHYYNSTRHWHKSAIFTIRDDFPKTTVPTKPVEPYQRTAGNTAIKVCLFQVDAWYQADIESGSNQSRAMRRGQKLQCMGVTGGRKEWLKSCLHLECLCFCVSWSKLRCQTVWCPLLHNKAFGEKYESGLRIWPQGEERQAPLFSALRFFRVVQLCARGQRNSILR